MLNEHDKEILKKIAFLSIQHGLEKRKPLKLATEKLPGQLLEKKASFVTLFIRNHDQKKLRGCVGSLIPHEPLARNVSRNAFQAAFNDARFPPLKREELSHLVIKISVLSELERLYPKNEEELLSQLQPFIDGLYLVSPDGKATFLPSVWEKMDSKEQFLTQLYYKAELSKSYPFSRIEWYRYTVEEF